MSLARTVVTVSFASLIAFATRAQEPSHVLHWNVAVLVFEGVELLDFAGPLEAFTQTRGFDPPMTVYTVGPSLETFRTNNVVKVVPDFTIDDCPPPDILVIPGGEVRELGGDTALARFVRAQVPRVQIAFSVCNAAFILRENGFLDGLEATTFHSMTGWLQKSAPRTKVHRDRRWVDNGRIVTAAGVSAGIDGALHLIHRLLGPVAARTAASRMEYRWVDDPGEQPLPEDRVIRARTLWYEGKWKQSLEDYRVLAAERPEDPVVLARLGTCQLFTRSADALATLERAAAAPANAKKPRVWFALGIARTRNGQHEAAASAYGTALSLDPSAVEVRQDLGVAQCEVGRFHEALVNLEAAWKAGRGDECTLARARLGSGDREGALALLEQAGRDADERLAERLRHRDFEALSSEPRFQAVLKLAEAAAKPK